MCTLADTQETEYKEVAWGLTEPTGKFKPMWINRPKVADKFGEHQVRFDMLYCGVCHSDIHVGRNELGGCKYPFVGGHELLGKVVEVRGQMCL